MKTMMHVNRSGSGHPSFWQAVDVPDDATVEQVAVIGLQALADALREKDCPLYVDNLRCPYCGRRVQRLDRHESDDEWIDGSPPTIIRRWHHVGCAARAEMIAARDYDSPE